MSAAYSPLPTQADSAYPPPRTQALLARLTPTAPPTRIRRLLLFLAVLALSSTLLVYLVFADSLSPRALSTSPYAGAEYAYAEGDSASPFFRDPHPALHTRLFLARAQAEIRARGLDTCGGQLSAPMVDGYVDAAVEYCKPLDTSPFPPPSITCFPVRAPGSRNSWWPYTQAFCASAHLSHTAGWGGDLANRGLFTAPCRLTEQGEALKVGMGSEVFLGTEFAVLEEGGAKKERECGETVAHPVLFVPRQDRWNPFHVGEDLVTTFLALTLFSRHAAAPSSPSSNLWTSLSTAYAKYASSSSSDEFRALRSQLADELREAEGLQLIFQDDHLPTESLFAPLYDRMGAFLPWRTGAEALGEGGPTCFTTAFHSVGAGASLLSATGVGKEYTCASELVWGASLWLRWVWGLEGVPGGDEGGEVFKRHLEGEVERRAPLPRGARDPVQVLFLSREKFDAFTRHRKQRLTGWQEVRHITNEHALVDGLRKGLAGLCRVSTAEGGAAHTAGAHECAYTDADALPTAWGVRMHAREARALGLQSNSGSGSPSTAAHGDAGAAPEAPAAQGRRAAWANGTSSSNANANAIATHGHAKRAASGARALRFATLDPTTAALAAQLGAAGRADVVVSVHAGALGLTLFMPTGRASVVELVPSGAQGNHHFHNMAHMMGMEYVRVDVGKTVDVSAVVAQVRRVVEARLAA
ncbi:hypothetical protein DFH07DRAFT_856129 [Mycena maculata]|uniref:Glycosyltransferase family 61 protein n=1 Tax=Mycena maculata TaxID=230809 RepID=A0AAD7MMT0_9AGAR|nr:hypothetical protein DFH07DRAFT_856129 [Mycena maculata]